MTWPLNRLNVLLYTLGLFIFLFIFKQPLRKSVMFPELSTYLDSLRHNYCFRWIRYLRPPQVLLEISTGLNFLDSTEVSAFLSGNRQHVTDL